MKTLPEIFLPIDVIVSFTIELMGKNMLMKKWEGLEIIIYESYR